MQDEKNFKPFNIDELEEFQKEERMDDLLGIKLRHDFGSIVGEEDQEAIVIKEGIRPPLNDDGQVEVLPDLEEGSRFVDVQQIGQ